MPGTGLEPASREAYAPKAYVSTNFTTRARVGGYELYYSRFYCGWLGFCGGTGAG